MSILYADSANPYLGVFNLLLLISGAVLVFLERGGNGLQYSKFVSPANKLPKIPGRIGFVMLYLPSFLAALLFAAQKLGVLDVAPALRRVGFEEMAEELEGRRDARLLAVALAMAAHFGKRVLEAMFLHRFSGKMDVGTCALISLAYMIVEIHLFYAQQISLYIDQPSANTFWLGAIVFLFGISGNFYHHYLLATLRKEGQYVYKVPHGGLFELVVCPHYLFEIIGFWGIALLSQAMTALSIAIFVSLYLTSRSFSTREWYLKKMDGFPTYRKALIPFIF